MLGWKIPTIVCVHHLSKIIYDNHNPKLKDFGIDSTMDTKLIISVVTENIGLPVGGWNYLVSTLLTAPW